MENDFKLTKNDIDNLIDAIMIWENEEQQVLATHEYLRSMQTEPDKLSEFDKHTAQKRKELQQESKKKRDISIILKYKLVKMKESIDAQTFLDGLNNDNTNRDNTTL
jgi:hypothetical protein